MVYAFLPLRQAGFRFLLQADFLTAANREDILTDRQWNFAIRDAVATSFVATVDIFKANPDLQHTWFRFIPRENEVVHPFFAPIVKQIDTQLRELPVIWTDAEDWCVPSKCVLVGPFKDENEVPLVQSQYLPYYYLSDVYAPDVRVILSSLGVRDMIYTVFLQGLCRMHDDAVFTSQPPDWLEDVCDKILTHGLSHGKNNPRMFQNEAALRGLPLAQRRDGSWSTCQTRQISSLLLDASGSAFPSGLPIEIINIENMGPRRQQLLRLLGVQDVSVKLVVKHIISVHDQPNSVRIQDILSHLQYMFKNRHSHTLSNKTLSTALWLVESTGKRLVRSADAYIEPTTVVAAELRLGNLLSKTANARLLHESLITEASATTDNRDWCNWLISSLGVATAPRLQPSGLPSSELEHIVNLHRIAQTGRLLSILRTYWTGMLGQLPPASRPTTATVFYDYLSKVEVRCANGVLAPLSSTYVLNELIKPFATPDMLVLPTPDIASDWSFLKNCGVTLDINADFFLKKLRSLAMQDARDVPSNQVEALYRQLDSRFHELSDTIRNAFRREPLILIGGSWCNAEHVVWGGPSILTLKRRLRLVYPHLFIFFRTHLGISDAPDEIVAAELRHFALSRAQKPLGREEVERLRQLLVFGSDTIERVEKGDMADWTASLRQEAILPVRTPNSTDIRLASASSGSFYVPDPSGFLANVFAQKVAFIDLDPAMVIRMQPLLARLGLDNRRIDNFVTREVTASGAHLKHVAEKEAWNTTETSFFVNRLPFLERVHYFTLGKLLPVQSALVFNVDKLDVSYTLSGGKVIVVSSSTDCWSIVQDNKLLIFLSAALEPQDYHNYPVAEAIITALNMRNEHLAHLRSILHDSDRDVARFLKTSGIREMQDHLRQTFEQPAEIIQEEEVQAAQSVTQSKLAISATASDVTAQQGGPQLASSPHRTPTAGLAAGKQTPRPQAVARSEAATGTTAPEKSAWQKGPPVFSALHGTRTAGPAAGQQGSPRPQAAARSEVVINATAPDGAMRQRGPPLSPILYSKVTAWSGSGQDSPQQKRGVIVANAGRSRASAEHSDPGDRLEVLHLERCAEQYSLTPAVNASAGNPRPPVLSRTNLQWNGEADPGNMDAAAGEDPAATRIGFLGENFVFQLLSKRLPGFGIINWTSNVRVRGGHPRFSGVELADFVYDDAQGVLTSMLFPEQVDLMGQRLEYFIEVKSTSGAASEPFHLSRRQLEQALSMTQSEDGQPGSQIFVLFRVSQIGNGEIPRVDIYADPHELVHRGVLRVVSNAVEFCIFGEEEVARGWY